MRDADPLDRIEQRARDYCATALDPDEVLALVKIARAARDLLADDDMPNDCVCSYCRRNRRLRAALAELEADK